MTEIRIVEYCGGNSFTAGWEKIYAIQPMQAFGNSDFADVEDFVEVIETELTENEELDLDGVTIWEFGNHLRSMLDGQNSIGVLTIERKQSKIEEELKMTLREYIEKYELDPCDAERFNMEATFKNEIFSVESGCSIVLFEDHETEEKSFLVSSLVDSAIYGEGDFYDDFLPHTQEALLLSLKWFFSHKFRTTENAKAICKAVNTAQKNKENELDIEEKMEQSISNLAGEDGNYQEATEEWQKWREDFAGDYICCTNDGDVIVHTSHGLHVEEWESDN